jgi:VWFA-related protein
MRDQKDTPSIAIRNGLPTNHQTTLTSRRGFLGCTLSLVVPAALLAQFKPANQPDQEVQQPGQAAPVLKKAPSDQTHDAQKAPTFSTGVKVVNVFATVRDKNGQVIKDLSKDEFQLKEDDHPETIQYFSRESNLPLTLGLLIDTSMSQRRVLGEERRASYRFFDQVMREDKDKAFVIHFDRDVELLQDLTSSKKRLEASLDEVNAPTMNRQSGGGSGYPQGGGNGGGYPGGGGYPSGGGHRRGGGGTTLYDAVLLGSNDLMKTQDGRKAMIVLTDGVDTGSKVSLEDSIEAAQRTDTLVYSILFSDEEAYGSNMPPMGMGRHGGMGRGGGYPGGGQSRPDGKKVLKELSAKTGGGFFEVSKKRPIEQIFDEIEAELRGQYSLGYVSDRQDKSTSFRRILVTTTRKGAVVQAREGYYPTA